MQIVNYFIFKTSELKMENSKWEDEWRNGLTSQGALGFKLKSLFSEYFSTSVNYFRIV